MRVIVPADKTRSTGEADLTGSSKFEQKQVCMESTTTARLPQCRGTRQARERKSMWPDANFIYAAVKKNY